MSHSLRLWLYAPLLFLTAFFLVCGWHSWHLRQDNREVWVECNAFALAQIPNSAATSYDYDIAGKDRFDISSVLKTRYPWAKTRLCSTEKEEGLPSTAKIVVGSPVLHSRFYATSQITLESSKPFYWRQLDVELSRSPLRFWDSSWHITIAKKHGT